MTTTGQKTLAPKAAALLMLCVTWLPAALAPAAARDPAPETAGGPAGASVPELRDYLRLTPEQRYALRMRARSLPEAERLAHNRALRAEIDKVPGWLYDRLHYERQAMDCRNGTYAPLPPPSPVDAWAYVAKVPHQRHDDRLAARALPPEDRAAYEARMTTALAGLPEWIRQALADEAASQDARHGLVACPASPP